jgi:two-component system NtrC family sensor kinase
MISPEVKQGDCLVGKVYHSGKPLLVKSASDDPRVTCITSGAGGIESMAAAPLSSKGTPLGVLAVAARRPARFAAMDIQLLATIGSQLGVAIENSTLIGQLRQKMRHIELISELSGIMNSSLSIGTIFRMVVSEIRNLIDYDRASLLLYDEKQENLLIFALDTGLKTEMKKGVRAPIEGTSAGWVARNNAPWINHDLNDARFPLDRKLLREGIRSTISIPLHHDRMLGVFNFDSTEPRKYSEKDLAVLLPVAKHMSVALENALLFEEISKEKKEWERTFDAFTDMVWIEDGRQQVLRANRTLLARTGFSEREIGSRLCAELLDRIGVSVSGCLCRDTLSTKRPSFHELKGTAGTMFHFWAYPLIDEEGRLYAIVHYLKDVTAQKRIEQQLIRTDKLASLGTLVAGIAHEINNPLGIIAGFSEALLDRAKDEGLRSVKEFEDFPEYLQTIHGEIFRSKKILKSLLEFARPSAGTFREIDINELIKEVMLLLNHKASRLNHHIRLDLGRDLPKIHADAGSLRQLLMNLLLNAIYFTPEGGSIVIRTGPDRTSGEGRGIDCRWIRLSVSDAGSGIPEDIIGKVFDPFFTTKPVGEGTGLGLTIAHRIVQEHGGAIDVESEPGKGTTFIIKLPAMRCKEG